MSTPEFRGPEGRRNPLSPYYRFRQLPIAAIINNLSIVFELHAMIENKGFVAVDFYDGCMIYDFDEDDLHFCDFDCYVQGAFVLEEDRLPGSTRFMAPEEFIKGSVIDFKTTVFNLGAAAFVYLGNGVDKSLEGWTAVEPLYHVAKKAVSPNREERFANVNEFYRRWNEALTVN